MDRSRQRSAFGVPESPGNLRLIVDSVILNDYPTKESCLERNGASSCHPSKFISGLRLRALVVIVLATAMGVTISRYRKVTFVVCDATLSTDKGLLYFELPLARHTREHPFRFATHYFLADESTWLTASGYRTSALQDWSSRGGALYAGGSIAGFGFWHGGEGNAFRSGPAAIVSLPIWCMGLFVYVSLFFRWRVTLRSAFILTAMSGLAFCLLTLQT
jgi:hypothetical protein